MVRTGGSAERCRRLAWRSSNVAGWALPPLTLALQPAIGENLSWRGIWNTARPQHPGLFDNNRIY